MTENQTTPEAPAAQAQETVPAAGKPLPEEQLAGIAGGNGFTDILGEGAGDALKYADNFVPAVDQPGG